MLKKYLIVMMFVLIGSNAFAADIVTDYVTKFKHDGWEYFIDNDYRAKNNVVTKQDLNGDMSPEILLGFQAYSGPEVKVPSSFLVLGKEKNGEFIIQYMVQGNDRFEKVELIDIDKDGFNEIVFWSGGGMHYTTLRIYKYADTNLECLFDNGSACGIDFEMTGGVPAIKVGRANWDKEGWCYADEPLWEVWMWNGEEFVIVKNKSSKKENFNYEKKEKQKREPKKS